MATAEVRVRHHGLATALFLAELWQSSQGGSPESQSARPEGFVGTQVHLFSGRWCCPQALGWCQHRVGTVCARTHTRTVIKKALLCAHELLPLIFIPSGLCS